MKEDKTKKGYWDKLNIAIIIGNQDELDNIARNDDATLQCILGADWTVKALNNGEINTEDIFSSQPFRFGFIIEGAKHTDKFIEMFNATVIPILKLKETTKKQDQD